MLSKDGMKLFRTLLTLGLVAVWPLVASHCKVEQLPGFQFLACVESDTGTTHQEGDCETDSCASLESGFYKTESGWLTVPPPLALLSPFLTMLSLKGAGSIPASSNALETAPPELPVSWQFSFRTALPVRAPSLAS